MSVFSIPELARRDFLSSFPSDRSIEISGSSNIVKPNHRSTKAALHQPAFQVSFKNYSDGVFYGDVKTGGRSFPVSFSWYGITSDKRDLRNVGHLSIERTFNYHDESSPLHQVLRAAAKEFVLNFFENSVQSIVFEESLKGSKKNTISGTLKTKNSANFAINFDPRSKLLKIEGLDFGVTVEDRYQSLSQALNKANQSVFQITSSLA
jgi:hypothetical protein